MKKILLAMLMVFSLCFVQSAFSAATCTTTLVQSSAENKVKVYKFAWTSHTDGTVAGVGGRAIQGILMEVEFVADVAPNVPTDLYDVQMLDSSGADVLRGLGTDVPILTTSTLRRITPRTAQNGSILLRPGEIVTPSISGAGSGKKGFIYFKVW